MSSEQATEIIGLLADIKFFAQVGALVVCLILGTLFFRLFVLGKNQRWLVALLVGLWIGNPGDVLAEGETCSPLGPCRVAEGSEVTFEDLPRQPRYAYRVFVPNGTTGEINYEWLGSSSSGVLTVAGGKIRVGTEIYCYAGEVLQPPDSERLKLSGVGSKKLIECLGRRWDFQQGGANNARFTAVPIGESPWFDEDERGLGRQPTQLGAVFRCTFPVIPGTLYRVSVKVLDTTLGSELEKIWIAPRTVGLPGVTGEFPGDYVTVAANVGEPQNFDACRLVEPTICTGESVVVGTVSYGLRIDSLAVDGGATQSTCNLDVNIFLPESVSLPSMPRLLLQHIYVLPVGFTLRTATGGSAIDNVWEDAPVYSAGERGIEDAIRALAGTGTVAASMPTDPYSAGLSSYQTAITGAVSSRKSELSAKLANLDIWGFLSEGVLGIEAHVMSLYLPIPGSGDLPVTISTLPDTETNIGAALDALRVIVRSLSTVVFLWVGTSSIMKTLARD